ncbi:MAG: hypothetical protein AAF738_05250, partial [Bacteroidota bacterium]
MPQADGTVLYGNEWINYQQSYFRINVAEDGIYRLSRLELEAAGVFNGTDVPVGSQLQLFHMGKSVPLYVSTTENLETDDFIEFYGEKNTGAFDKYLYVEPEFQVNPAYSLFTDTAAYYLTWQALDNNVRFQAVNNSLNDLPPKENSCLETLDFVFNDNYSNGQASNSSSIQCRYVQAEGYTSRVDSVQTINFNTPQAIQN